jgi:hypothetical protein
MPIVITSVHVPGIFNDGNGCGEDEKSKVFLLGGIELDRAGRAGPIRSGP